MEYSTETQVLLNKYNASFADLTFCTLLSAGMDQADAFAAAYPKKAKQTRIQAKAAAQEIMRLNPSFRLLIPELKKKNNNTTNAQSLEEMPEEEKERYKTRKGIIEEMIKNLQGVGGKEAIGALQSLAKLQGFDKPEEKEEAERRKFVLRWLSQCRTCKLMRLFMDVQDEIA